MDDYFVGSGGPQRTPAPSPSPAPPAMAYQPPPQTWPPPSAQGWPAPAPQGWPSQPQPKGMSIGIKVLIGVAVVVGSIVVIGIVAAIVLPLFLNERAKDVAARTTVSIPSTAAGLSLLTDPASERMAQRLKDLPLPGEHLAGVYGGATGPEAVVSVTKQAMSSGDQWDYLAGSVHSAQRASADGAAEFGDVAPGALGGKVQCSVAPTMTVCFFADAGAYGSVVVFGTPQRGAQLVPQLRAAVEHRS